ncbi:MAG: prolyl-tRNA synthetase [Candidatus Zambryskibacteria bacterium RIFCSPLOWO2_02_FULL_44_12b]|uniref:Proline--tRNA ligase n=1 Tax=Candidatus Zambryskibacteria bacterium RIFCSPLOWO2_02_FULL_44_12b TaxID=1802772 RepID=A0A1G2UK20_9BACT|nr:MAG: prolyl-tRNA synthetase [Candidatus Zambryskibacteria bacterium RIFCSPLOWO2_02_FULL_44_12b]
MRQSTLFTKTRREAPKDEVSKNAILLTRAGFIHKELAGVYSYLPLGLRVLKKIENIIREEMNKLGAQEVELAALQDKSLWEKTGRWDDKVVDNWFKIRDENLGLGLTHEEPLTVIMKDYVQSYRDLPLYIYQFQTKFRKELRAKSGIMRGKEFLMKDLYSFSRTGKEHDEFYEKAKVAYRNIFDRVGIGDSTYFTLASGGSFSKYSHEFQTLTEAGEDTIYIKDEAKKEAVNKELEMTDVQRPERKAVEVGNIFSLGTRFSEALGLNFKDEKGEEKPVIMGSYGIGLGRLMGTVVEVLSDEEGIVWPKEIAPFQVHLLLLGEKAKDFADEVYKTLTSKGIEVLYDDRDVRAGEKFADADLIGIPLRAVVGDKALESKLIEVKERTSDKTKNLSVEELIKEINK